MRVEKIVDSLCTKYQSRDPFEIANNEGTLVLYENLGSVKGYYNKVFRQKIIHLNLNLGEKGLYRTCAHELGHSVLHPESNTPFLKGNTLFPIGKYEKEADYFAVDLLYSDDDIKEFLQYPASKIAECLGLPIQLVEYRISVIK